MCGIHCQQRSSSQVVTDLVEHRLKKKKRERRGEKKKEISRSPSKLLPCTWGGIKQDFSLVTSTSRNINQSIYSEICVSPRLLFSFIRKRPSNLAGISFL